MQHITEGRNSSNSIQTDLKEVRKGTTGQGLLIENDGYITTTREILREGIENQDEWHVPYPFVVNAVFQKYGIKNANGRIYPEETLKREVEKYQERIRERRALGECYTPDARVLTETGWKSINEIREGELVYTLNPDGQAIELKPVDRIVEKYTDGEIFHVCGIHMDERVTEGHKYPLYTVKNDRFSKDVTVRDMTDGTIRNSPHLYIPLKGNWHVTGTDTVTLQKTDRKGNDLTLKPASYVRLTAAFLARGGCNKETKETVFACTNAKESHMLEIILEECSLVYDRVLESDGSTRMYIVTDPRVYAYFSENEGRLPYELRMQPSDVLEKFYRQMMYFDGSENNTRKKSKAVINGERLTCRTMELAEDMCEVLLKTGKSGTVREENGRFNVYQCGIKGIRMDMKRIRIAKEAYKGKVYCLEVDNHSFYVMSNGKPHWTGNCNHPQESSIDLTRVSHNITELHWEGHTLVGQMEIFTSYGFRKHGIVTTCGDMVANLLLSGYKIGVSSRAVGSVEERLGVMYVGDDLEIIAWDVVADPSTPGSYILSSEQEKAKYVEGKEEDKTKDPLNEKIDKLKKILD